MSLAANLAALARRLVGTAANNLVALDGAGKLPAVDGSQLKNLVKQSAEVATTSGTAKDFTGIPADAKRIIVVWSLVVKSGSAHLVLQLGTYSGIESTGYNGSSSQSGGSNSGTTGFNYNTGFLISVGSVSTNVHKGVATLAKIGGNKWALMSVGGRDDAPYATLTGAEKTLSGVLDRIRFTPSNGTDVFSAGSVSVMWE
jgi:hypothetical protein